MRELTARDGFILAKRLAEGAHFEDVCHELGVREQAAAFRAIVTVQCMTGVECKTLYEARKAITAYTKAKEAAERLPPENQKRSCRAGDLWECIDKFLDEVTQARARKVDQDLCGRNG